MKKRKKYREEPIGKIEIVEDFLPKPRDLVLKKEETAKTTISLTIKKL